MPAQQGFLRWLDEHDPAVAAMVRKKRAARVAMALRRAPAPGGLNVDIARDRARDLCDPED